MFVRSETPRPVAAPSAPQRAHPIEVWNLRHGRPAYVGAQPIVNVVGRVTDPDVASLAYRLNGGGIQEVALATRQRRHARLPAVGDYNIDTIVPDQLEADNELVLIGRRSGHGDVVRRVRFGVTALSKLRDVTLVGGHVSELGQVVDGRWRAVHAPAAALALTARDAGYDRLILLARNDGEDVRVETTMVPQAWTSFRHSVGLVFGWQGHERGDGARLPQTWSSGLAYYSSKRGGLVLREGTDVRYDGRAATRDVIHGVAPVSAWHSSLDGQLGLLLRRRLPVLRPGVSLRFVLELVRGHGRVELRAGRRHHAEVTAPLHQAAGAIGVLAHHAAVRVTDFSCTPLRSPS